MTEDLLPESDREFLDEKGYDFSLSQVGGNTHLIIHQVELTEAYTPRVVDLLIMIPPGYPNANVDMFWTRPVVTLANGAVPRATEHRQTYEDVEWQRWSRHIAWRAGVDDLRSFLTAAKRELSKGI